jgi:hypothetical protein
VVELRRTEQFANTVDFGVLTVREDEMAPMARRCRNSAVQEFLVRGRQDYLLFDVAVSRELNHRLTLVRSIRQAAGEARATGKLGSST